MSQILFAYFQFHIELFVLYFVIIIYIFWQKNCFYNKNFFAKNTLVMAKNIVVKLEIVKIKAICNYKQ